MDNIRGVFPGSSSVPVPQHSKNGNSIIRVLRVLYREGRRSVSEIKVGKLFVRNLLIVEVPKYLVHQLLFGLCIV